MLFLASLIGDGSSFLSWLLLVETVAWAAGFLRQFWVFFATVGVRGFFCDGDRRKGFL